MSTAFYPGKHSAKKAADDGGQAADDNVGQEPSGPMGDNPATAGPGKTKVNSRTPENKTGHINPSAPEDANVTPGSIAQK